MTLRRKLVALIVGVVALGLAIFAVTSYVLYSHSERVRTEQQLGAAIGPMTLQLCQAAGICAGSQGPRPAGEPAKSSTTGADRTEDCGYTADSAVPPIPGTWAELRTATNDVVLATVRVPFSKHVCPNPALPDHLPPIGATVVVPSAGTAPGPYLVQAALGTQGGPQGPAGPNGLGGSSGAAGAGPGHGAGPGSSGGPDGEALAGDIVIVAVPLNSVATQLRDLLILDLAVGGALLVLLAVVTLLVVRRSLQPLERMVGTAQSIAGGDLSQRVETTDERTEVGQLGGALNHMLGNIEEAFAARRATEWRLRQFLADASHELRTPLTSIRGYAELWRLSGQRSDGTSAGGPIDTPSEARVDTAPEAHVDTATAMARIEHHAIRMGDLIEELLLLARMDEARPPERRAVDLVVLAAEACDDAVAMDPARAVTLHAADPVTVIGDEAHLRRAVTNLVTNAVRHTPSDSPIDVWVHLSGGAAEVAVRDHGPGLDPDGLQHAFDRFWQADASRATGGTGLGLAIVATVAAEHGGAATVANAPDGGAVFTVRLPVPRPAGAVDGAPAAAAGAGSPATG